MTGYLYQCELALLELAERSWEDISIEVRMEVLDDVEFLYAETKDPFVLLQSKHREKSGQLSETGKDFWRSVASWIDALTVLGCLSSGTVPLLRLVTTQVAAEGTFLSQLRRGPGRSAERALAGMERVARAGEPRSTAEDCKKFLGLTSAQRRRLVEAIEIHDVSPLMSDLDSKLARMLGIRPGQDAGAILNEIKGWWYGMADGHPPGAEPQISNVRQSGSNPPGPWSAAADNAKFRKAPAEAGAFAFPQVRDQSRN